MATELERLREENDLLRLRVEELEGILLRQEVPFCIGLTRKQAQVLSVLMARPIASRPELMTALYSLAVEDPPADKIIDLFVMKLRRALAPHGVAIRTRWGQGWFLTNEDKAKVRALS